MLDDAGSELRAPSATVFRRRLRSAPQADRFV